MVSKDGIVDFTNKEGRESKKIIGRKVEGVDPGLLSDTPGMLKFGKNLLSSDIVRKSQYHTGRIIGDSYCQAFRISRFGFEAGAG